jgi:hypothetical protein
MCLKDRFPATTRKCVGIDRYLMELTLRRTMRGEDKQQSLSCSVLNSRV